MLVNQVPTNVFWPKQKLQIISQIYYAIFSNCIMSIQFDIFFWNICKWKILFSIGVFIHFESFWWLWATIEFEALFWQIKRLSLVIFLTQPFFFLNISLPSCPSVWSVVWGITWWKVKSGFLPVELRVRYIHTLTMTFIVYWLVEKTSPLWAESSRKRLNMWTG